MEKYTVLLHGVETERVQRNPVVIEADRWNSTGEHLRFYQDDELVARFQEKFVIYFQTEDAVAD